MRFRLPAGTFPELELAKEDMDNMEDVAAMIVDSAIDEFERLRLDNNGLADKRWKPIKRKAGVMLLFRQKREGLIEVYMSGCVDAMGYRYPIYTSIVITQIADALLSFQRLLLNARMKKLAWMLNNKNQPRDASKKSKSECSSCGCNLGRMILSGRRECTICRKLVCPPCRVPLKVAWKPREDPNLFANENQTTMKVRFEKAQVCRPCLHIADRTDALDVAIDEIRRASPLLAAESGMAVTSASSLFSLINSDKFDRDCFFHSYQ
ncbi:hypothetical protein PRIC1_003732 [Phytophthora ramorum]